MDVFHIGADLRCGQGAVVETSLVEGALKNAVRRAKADPHGTLAAGKLPLVVFVATRCR